MMVADRFDTEEYKRQYILNSEMAPGEGVANSNPYGGLEPGIKQPPAYTTIKEGGMMKFTPAIFDSNGPAFFAIVPGPEGVRVQNLNYAEQVIYLHRTDLRPLVDALIKAEAQIEKYWEGR